MNWKYLAVTVITAVVVGGGSYYYFEYNKDQPVEESCPIVENEPETTIAIYGDSRNGHEIHRAIVDYIDQVEPLAIFNNGDMVEDGDDPEDWAIFNDITEDIRAKYDYYPALGNHEKDSQLYYDNFYLPNNEIWYSLDIDNIHMIVLDSDRDLSSSSEQYGWVEQDLKARSKRIDYTVVVMHHPPFSSGSHQNDNPDQFDDLVPLFEKEGVDIVFVGHDHDYERLEKNDIIYVVIGSSGAPLYDQKNPSPFSKLFLKSYSYALLYVDEQNLDLSVYNEKNELIDSLEL